MSADSTLYCSFCGKSQHEVRKLVAGQEVFICDECVGLCSDIVRQDSIAELLAAKAVPTPTEIHKVLDDAIGGQDHVKQVLSIVLHRHYRRVADATKQASAVLSPTNILLRGPSMGRSEIANALTRRFHLHIAVIDAVKLVEMREARGMCQLIVGNLLKAADYHIGNAQCGIVYIDDFDHIGRGAEKPSDGPNELCTVVQEALAGLMEGSLVEVPVQVTGSFDLGKALTVDTKSITFIFGGTFFGLSNSAASQTWNSAPGQDTDEEGPNSLESLPHLSDGQAQALVEFGLLPDLVDHLAGVAVLRDSEDFD